MGACWPPVSLWMTLSTPWGSRRYESDPPTLMIARFADATLNWKDEGVNITMHHDYHSERNIARITVTVQTQQPDWTGEILVSFLNVH